MSFKLYSLQNRVRSLLGFFSSTFTLYRVSVAPLFGLALFSLIGVSLFIFVIVFSNPLSASKSDAKANGFYSLTSPLVISTAPKVIITEGRLRFFDGSVKKNKADLLGGLPFNWTDLFIAKKLSHIELTEAKITLDFRGAKSVVGKELTQQDTNQLLRTALKKSELEHIKITKSSLTILRDFTKPLQVDLKSSQFEVDLDDHEIDGTGQLNFSDKVTDFSLSHEFSSKNKKGTVLNEINLSLKNDDFVSNFEGVLEGRSGLHFKGNVSLEIVNINHSNLSFDKSKTSGTSDAIRFMASGPFIWSNHEGTLSDGQFKFGLNKASGSLSLRLSQSNPEVTGTLAFETLNFSDLHTLKRRTKPVSKAKETTDEGTPLISTLKLFTPLIRDYDADVRLSANRIKLHDLEINDAGLSLFQKKGELLIDMAGLNLLEGTATGLIKIDTNSPKPRWHINSGFKNINLSQLSAVLPNHSLLKGIGHLKLKLTSFGDKGEEISENMSGSLHFTLPKGGQVSLDLNQFIGEQEKNSEQTLKDLKSGESSFQFLNGIAHFAKGSVIFDHFMVSTKKYDFTGHGFLNLKSQALNWHVASWETTELVGNSVLSKSSQDDKSKLAAADEIQNDKQAGDNKKIDEQVIKTPLLLTCSHIRGFWDALSFEKYTALHLSLLNKACPAFYHYDQLKTKDHPIVHSDNAR